MIGAKKRGRKKEKKKHEKGKKERKKSTAALRMATLSNVDKLEMIYPEDGGSSSSKIPEAYRLNGLIIQREYLVNGQLLHWEGALEEVKGAVWTRAADGSLQQAVIGGYPLLTGTEAQAALRAAVDAYGNGAGAWPRMTVAERIGFMQQFVVRMKEKREQVVRLLMWEIGKNLKDSQREFDRTVEYIVDTIDALKDLDRTSSRFTISQGIVAQVRRAPLGVVLTLGPYNYPLNETYTTLIPALLMGNTVIFKPPRMGVLLHQPLLEAFRDSFPPGVINTVYGDGATVVGPIMSSGQVSVLAFIGSSRVGDILKRQHPKPHRLRCVLGLEAKNAAIVLPDADLDLAVSECVLGVLSFNGQRCTAIKAVWVHRAIADKFVPAFVARINALRPGMPWENADLTPLPDVDSATRMERLLKDALDKGAKLLNPGGGRRAGSFFHPAVVGNVTQAMALWSEEQFGPITPIMTFFDVAEPIRYIDESNYGQQVAIFGRDSSTISGLIDSLVNQVCRVNINSAPQRGPDILPFTGRKDSAEGTLSVSDALRVFSIRTLVAAKTTEANNSLLTDVVQHRKSRFLSTDFIL
jgi:glyceraldehyde-3-phosphate dehydrogenase (NADP+)